MIGGDPDPPSTSARCARVVILDDDPHFGALVCMLLERAGHSAQHTTTFEETEAVVRSGDVDALILDYQLDDCEGIDLIGPLHEIAPNLVIVLMTAHSSPHIATESLDRGAFDFLTKPVDEGRLIATIARAVTHRDLVERIAKLDHVDSVSEFEGIIGASTRMRAVFRLAESVAPTDASVMIRGDSGTGKELVARAIHNRSKRRDRPFVALNMAALPRDLVEATLFGHEKGAFTGASSSHVGACEEAAGGTLFLDEIGEMPLDLQSKLLRFLQEGVFRRVGGSRDIHSDARILSATNRDPLDEVENKRFREDLYYRLNVVPIELPRLADREHDIDLLAHHAMRTMNERHGKRFKAIEPTALELLRRYSWPGNVRQLLHVFERIVILEDAETLTAAMLPEVVRATPPEVPGPGPDFAPQSARSEPAEPSILTLAELERRAIEDALRICRGSAPEAAMALGISQATIYRKLKAYGIDRAQFKV